jgi:hypothetical protein
MRHRTIPHSSAMCRRHTLSTVVACEVAVTDTLSGEKSMADVLYGGFGLVLILCMGAYAALLRNA